MIMIIRKKVIVVSILGLMLTAVGFISYMQSDTKTVSNDTGQDYVPIGEAKMVSSSSVSQNDDDYFKKTRINRESQRSGSIDLLNETINNTASSPESKKEAEEKLTAISLNMETEANCEGLIIAKGYKDCIVYITDESVNVVVKNDDELTSADTAKIRDIIYEQTNNNNIKIVAVE